LTHVEQSAEKCVRLLDQMGQAFFILDDAHSMIDPMPLPTRSIAACRS
jgi:hypothetical protein